MNTNIFQAGFEVNGDDLLDSHAMCPICLSREKRGSVITIQSNPLIQFLRCNNCRGISASHMPTTELLDKYYAGYYETNDLMVTFYNIDRFADHILKYIERGICSDNIAILDFGGGDGSLAIKIAEKLISKNKNMTVDVLLVDYIRDNLKGSSNSNIKFNVKENLNDVATKFDIILASGIIEHIPEPNSVIKKLFSILKDGGYFYARTPYMTPYKKMLRNLDMSYPAHVHDLGASFWNRFIDTFNLDAQFIVSQPSVVETEFSAALLLTLASYLLKFPAQIELKVGKRKDLVWNYYGGWEIILKINEER